MNVADAMTPRSEVVMAELPGTRDEALAHFQQGSFSSMPVVKRDDGGEEFRGLVSRERLMAEPDEDQVALLVEEVESVAADAPVGTAVAVINSTSQRRVPVVDDGDLAGIVTVARSKPVTSESVMNSATGSAGSSTLRVGRYRAPTALIPSHFQSSSSSAMASPVDSSPSTMRATSSTSTSVNIPVGRAESSRTRPYASPA